MDQSETILVTGASGFIGKRVVQKLSELGHHVIAVSRYPHENENLVQWSQLDLLDGKQTTDFIANIKPDRIIHLAWNVKDKDYRNSTDNLAWLQASISLLHACVQNGCRRIVTAGTCAEYVFGTFPMREDITAASTETLYAACKHSLYEIGFALCKQKDVSFAHGRIFYVYGPDEQATRVFPYVICRLLTGTPALVSSGTQVLDYMHVDDVASAFIRLAFNENTSGAVNICSGTAVPLKTCFEQIAKATGAPAPLLRIGAVPGGNTASIIAGNNERLQATGWKQQYSLESGICDTVSWWRNILR